MAQVPDGEDLRLRERRENRIERREVERAAAIDERPGNRLARDADADAGEKGVVLACVLAMPRLGDDVPTAVALPVERRALEARQEERRKDAELLRDRATVTDESRRKTRARPAGE
jgi:hypothetical protein